MCSPCAPPYADDTSRTQKPRKLQHSGPHRRRSGAERTTPALVSSSVLSHNIGGDSCGRNSTEHKGLFLLSFLGIGTGSLARLSPDGAALTASHAARIHATPAETWRPGIAEQYALQLDKLSAGTASLEVVSMPTYFSRPSTSALSAPRPC